MGTLHEDLYTFMIISHLILCRMRDVVDKSCREIKTHILCSITPPLPPNKNRAIYEIMWKNLVEPHSPRVTMENGTCSLCAG